MKITLQEDLNTILSRKSQFDNMYLNELTDFIITTQDRGKLNSFVRVMFYLDSLEEYYETFLDYSNIFHENADNFFQVYNIFKEWKPYCSNLSNIRGIFLELLSHKFLEKIYSDEKIYLESKIILDDYETYYLDFVINQNFIYECFECKFSSHSIKKRQIDSLLGLKNKSNIFSLNLVFFETMNDVIFTINNSNLSYMVNEKHKNKFNYITLESFSKENPFNA